jgi:arylsulfatase A-like enzyme
LVLVTSDHGEAFGEHTNFRHGWGQPSIRLHDELIRVPVIAWNPRGIPGRRISRRPVMLSDIAPSLLSSHRITQPPSMLGTDLSALWAGAAEGASSGLPHARNPARSVSHTQAYWSLRDANHKLIVHMGENGTDTFELYDLWRDPGEHSDVAAQRPLLVGRLRDELLAVLPQLDIAVVEGGKAAPRCPLCEWSDITAFWDHELADASAPVEAGDLAPEAAERLRALGYLN